METRRTRRAAEALRRRLRRSRSCGPCTACCTTFAVKLTERETKPSCTPCRHLEPGGAGCAIYDARPRECRDFECAWRMGVIDEAARPDLAGAIFVVSYADPSGWCVIRAREIREGPQTEAAKRVVQKLYDAGHVVVWETLAELRERIGLGDEEIVKIRFLARPGHPIHSMAIMPSSQQMRRAARGEVR